MNVMFKVDNTYYQQKEETAIRILPVLDCAIKNFVFYKIVKLKLMFNDNLKGYFRFIDDKFREWKIKNKRSLERCKRCIMKFVIYFMSLEIKIDI